MQGLPRTLQEVETPAAQLLGVVQTMVSPAAGAHSPGNVTSERLIFTLSPKGGTWYNDHQLTSEDLRLAALIPIAWARGHQPVAIRHALSDVLL